MTTPTEPGPDAVRAAKAIRDSDYAHVPACSWQVGSYINKAAMTIHEKAVLPTIARCVRVLEEMAEEAENARPMYQYQREAIGKALRDATRRLKEMR